VLSVMAWVAAYAGWSSVLGLVIAAVTGDRPREVSSATSAAFIIVGPLVPTLVALWFNDWARDGFPTREQQRAGRSAAMPVVLDSPVYVDAERLGDAPAILAAPSNVRTVAAHPLGVPEAPDAAWVPGEFPVAPLLRDRD
jgi:hypothetical protein